MYLGGDEQSHRHYISVHVMLVDEGLNEYSICPLPLQYSLILLGKLVPASPGTQLSS